MILSLVAVLAVAQAPAETAFERYGRCLRIHAKVAACTAERQHLLAEAESRLNAKYGSGARAEAERRVQMIDAMVPVMNSEGPIKLVPAPNESSELKDRK
jgi:hypothetical protein